MPDTKRTATGVLSGVAGLVGLSVVAGVLITATVTPAIAVTGAAASSAITIFDNMPSYLEPTELMEPTTLLYKDPNSDGWLELTSYFDQNRSPVTFDQVSTVMYDAILSSEDPRYYEHGGVDLIGTTRAMLSNLEGGSSTQGGSSISQQYVKNILIQRCEWDAQTDEEKQACFTAATESSGTDGIERKLQEMRYAIALEQEFSKNDILLGYLNIANFGGITYGVDAAARYYFNVSAADLNIAQAAVLAGVVQNPNTYRIDQPNNEVNGAADGYSLTKQRQEYVLGRMLEDGKITQEQHDEAVAAPIEPAITQPVTGCASSVAPYYCQYVVEVIKKDPSFGETAEERQTALRRGGLSIYTTLDINLQNSAAATMANYAPQAVDGMNFGAASVNLEADTGRVLSITQNTRFSETEADSADPAVSSLVYAGNLEFGGSTGFNAGSTFKIFTLVDWLEQGRSVNEVINGVNRVFPRATNSCTGDWVNTSNDRIGNFGGSGGFVGTPMRFTSTSLNSGFLAMATELDLCDIANVATKMGVTRGDGTPIPMENLNEVIGSDAVSPMAMAGAYATVANNGIYCEPQPIERVTDSNGNELPDLLPDRSCERVLSEDVAATAAYALEGVMNGGTGGGANNYDGVPVLGKTGTHEGWNTWMIESSSKVATAVWVGNSEGFANLFGQYYNGYQLSDLRYVLAREIQGAANGIYGGNAFPGPAQNLTRTVLRDVPSVVGMTVEEAESTLTAQGFSFAVGDPIDSDQPTDRIVEQTPAGQAAGGSTVTVRLSNGQGGTIPSVSGTVQNAQSQLASAGFTNVALGTCTVDSKLTGNQTAVTGTSPGAGAANKSTTVQINYTAATCN